MVAICFSLLGFSELAARLPAALLGLAGVVVTYFLGRRMFGERAGFLGAVVLATSPLYIIVSRIVVHDAALVFSMTLAWFAFYSSFVVEKHRSTYLLLFYADCGLAILAKGNSPDPVGTPDRWNLTRPKDRRKKIAKGAKKNRVRAALSCSLCDLLFKLPSLQHRQKFQSAGSQQSSIFDSEVIDALSTMPLFQ